MNRLQLCSCLAAIFVTLFFCQNLRGNEIWVGEETTAGNNIVVQYDMNGNHLSSFSTGGTGGISSMLLTGNQVWVDNMSGGITRFDLAGNILGSVPGNFGFSIAVVANEVWVYRGSGANNIYQYSLAGTYIGQFTPEMGYAGSIIPINGMAQVGNQVWFGQGANSTGYGIGVFDLSGKYLYGLLKGKTAGTVVSVGNQVWTSTGDYSLNRYDPSGNLLGAVSIFPDNARTISSAGDKVWAVTVGGATFGAYDLTGQPIPGFDSYGGTAQAIVEVPEPSTVILFAIGFIVLTLRRIWLTSI